MHDATRLQDLPCAPPTFLGAGTGDLTTHACSSPAMIALQVRHGESRLDPSRHGYYGSSSFLSPGANDLGQCTTGPRARAEAMRRVVTGLYTAHTSYDVYKRMYAYMKVRATYGHEYARMRPAHYVDQFKGTRLAMRARTPFLCLCRLDQ